MIKLRSSRKEKLIATFLSVVTLASSYLFGCNKLNQPNNNEASSGGGYSMPEAEVYSWVNDSGFRDLSSEDQLELISYDLYVEDESHSRFEAIAIGSDGSIYVTGYTVNSEELVTAILVKYNSDLNRMAIVRKPEYIIWGLAIDLEGNIYTTGESGAQETNDSRNELDEASHRTEIVKYNSALEELAVVSHDGFPRTVAIAIDGSVYVAGGATITKYNSELILEKTVVWKQDNHNAKIERLVVALDGSVYVTAMQDALTNDGAEAMLAKYNSNLELQCMVCKNEADVSFFYGLAVASDGSVYVTLAVFSRNSHSATDNTTSIIKYDSNLNEISSVDNSIVDSLPSASNKPSWSSWGSFGSLTINSEGFIYVSTSNVETSIVLFNSDLTPLNFVFMPNLPGFDSKGEKIYSIAVASDGSVYAVGAFYRPQAEFSWADHDPLAAIIVR